MHISNSDSILCISIFFCPSSLALTISSSFLVVGMLKMDRCVCLFPRFLLKTPVKFCTTKQMSFLSELELQQSVSMHVLRAWQQHRVPAMFRTWQCTTKQDDVENIEQRKRIMVKCMQQPMHRKECATFFFLQISYMCLSLLEKNADVNHRLLLLLLFSSPVCTYVVFFSSSSLRNANFSVHLFFTSK